MNYNGIAPVEIDPEAAELSTSKPQSGSTKNNTMRCGLFRMASRVIPSGSNASECENPSQTVKSTVLARSRTTIGKSLGMSDAFLRIARPRLENTKVTVQI